MTTESSQGGKGEPPGMRECYVAFLDLMGVRNLVRACAEDPATHAAVIEALQETKNISPFFGEKREIESGQVRRWRLQVQAFSDCVVLFIPTESNMLSWLLASVRRLHDRLLRLNVPLRGGITIGGMHWDDEWSNEEPNPESDVAAVAFGPGLVAAYDLEDSVATYPRILMSDVLIDHIMKLANKAKAFPLGGGDLRKYCRQDADGLHHLHVLHPEITRKDSEGITEEIDSDGKKVIKHNFTDIRFDEWLASVRDFVSNGVGAVSGEKLQAKYRWLARYFNEVARETNGVEPIRIFRDEIPSGAIPLTIEIRQEKEPSRPDAKSTE